MTEFKFPAILMQDGKFWRLEQPTDLGPQDEKLKEVSAALPTNMPNAFILNGEPVHIQSKSNYVIVWSEIKMLPIRTIYTIAGDGTRYPLFKKKADTSPPEHEALYDFEPAVVGMRMFFVSVMGWISEKSAWRWSSTYLVTKAPKRKEIFRPPLPNIYSDSRLCMGNYVHSGPFLIDVFAHSLAHLSSSNWNSDAMEGLDGDNIKALYSFKDNKQQKPPKDYKWWECQACVPVSTEYFGDLPLV